MFPIIPQHIVKNNNSIPCRSSDRGGVFKLNSEIYRSAPPNSGYRTQHRIPPRSAIEDNRNKQMNEISLKSSTFISRDTTTKCFTISEFFKTNNFSLPPIVNLRVSQKGLLQPTDYPQNNFGPSWIRHIPLSNDVHSHNLVLETISGEQIQLRATKNIDVGQDLQMWFSEDVLGFMQIPFLTPSNIQGQNRYTCHFCGKIFEDPNPLKIHLATNCEKQSIDLLWNRLKCSLTSSYNDSNPSISPTTSLNIWDEPRVSAFHPVHRIPSPASTIPEHHGMVTTNAAAAAHLETIVSNMGTSNKGHLCIYCGKLYSRKYGLKIHIRTHTGFKPLKCKYCLRPFGDPSNLNKHVRLHVQGNSIYRCHLCEKVLVRRRDLQRHIQTRHMNDSESATHLSSSSSEDLSNI